MTTQAQYASTVYANSGSTTTADTSYSQPTNSTVGVIATATATGMRIDELTNICQGTSVAGLLRIWECQGTMGPTVSGMSAVTTTVTVMTGTAHGRVTGDLVTMQNAFPNEYNVTNAAITVTTTTAFTYTVSTAPVSAAATTVGVYSHTPATAVYTLLKEFPIIATVGSSTLPAWQLVLTSALNGEFLPRILPAGWSLRTTVSATQTNAIKTTATGGQFT